MPEPRSLLTTSSETEDFARQGRRIPRSIRELPDDNSDTSLTSFPNLLEEVIENGLRSVSQGSARSWRCLCIEVAEDDGMTWSAESARRAAADSAAQFRQVCLPQSMRPDRLPQIASWIGEYKFLRLAVAHKLTSEFVTLRSWMTPVLVAAVVLSTGLLELLKRLSAEHAKSAPGFVEALLQPSFWAQTAALFAGTFVLKSLKSRLDTRSESKSCDRFVKQLADIPRIVTYPRFLQALAEEMARDLFPRVVIVDNFEGQDKITRDVINEYFQNIRKLAIGSEFWIVFEKEDGDRIGALLRNEARPEDKPFIKLYKQLFLTAPEKKSLLNLLQQPAGTEEYTTVRSICRRDGKGAEAVERFLKEYRQAHPAQKQQYDALHILYLLALTASPGQATFDVKKLASTLSQSGPLRTEVLREFLSTSKIFRNELEDSLKELARFPGDVVIWDDPDRTFACCATREVQDFLVRKYGDFRLPDPGAGHLFWAFLYFDQLQNHVREAFWVRKLIFHLAHSSTKSVNRLSSYPKLRQQLFDAHLFAASAALGSCLFKDVPALLQRALSLLDSDDSKLGKQQQNRLLKTCWNVYSVLGDGKILQIVLELYSPGPREVVAADLTREHALALFFTDLLPLQPQQRSILNDDFFRWILLEDAGDHAILDDCRVRAAWFIFTSAPMLELWNRSYLLHTLLHADRAIEDLARRALARLRSPANTPPRLADAITLSLALWSCALRFQPGVRERTFLAWCSHSGGMSQPLPNPELSSLLDLCQQTLDVAVALREYREPDTTLAGNVLFGAMARELGVMSLAAAQVACALRLRLGEPAPDDSFYPGLQSIALRCSQILDSDLPRLASPEDLLGTEMTERTGALLRACELVWQDFGLTCLHEFLNLRRVHFAALAQEMPPAHFDESSPLVKSLIPLLASSSYGGVLASSLVASCLQATPQLSAFYLHRAALTATGAAFQDTLKDELCLLAVAAGHMYDFNLTTHLTWLLREPPSPSPLDEFLASLQGDSLISFAFAVMNIAHVSRPSELGSRVLAIFRKLSASDTLPHATREQLRAILDSRELELQLHQGLTVRPADVLKNWEDRKNQDVYSTVLDRLIQNGFATPQIEEESLSLLRAHLPKHSYSGFLHLSLSLGARFHHARRSEDDIALVTAFLKTSIRQWEAGISASLTVNVYKLLSELEPSRRGEYLAHVANAECIVLRCNYVKHLPELALGGRFFPLFFDYWKSMSYWGLCCDWGSDVFPQLNLEPSKRQALANEWQERGATVPPPLDSRMAVSGEFLVIGNALISPPLDGDPKFDSARQAFNQSAQGALPLLLRSVGMLQGLPVSIKILIHAHEVRLEEFTSIFAPASGPSRIALARKTSSSAG